MVLQILNTKCQMGMVAPQMVGREWDKLALEPDLFTEYKVEIGECGKVRTVNTMREVQVSAA